MPFLNLAAPSTETPIVDKLGLMTKSFKQYLDSLIGRVQVGSYLVASPILTALTAALALTPLIPIATAGLYRVQIYARVTVVASINSSIIPSVTTTDGGIVCTQTGAALTSNLTNAPTSWTFLVRCDAGTPLSYAVAYVSNAAGMTYQLSATVEQVA